ncbi:glycosyltransferase family 39 protein [Horticoccus sp. 23ND18S-11]|uniref:glycosyltransferase family 39 protein n=1 Tax=Horticoccus sp. 23ND18S-11 TaxID=3391832 RepID=UPI0039C9C468
MRDQPPLNLLGDPLGGPDEPGVSPWWATWPCLVVLAVATRCVRYFAHFPLWEDECFLGVSLHQRDFLGLLQPLEYHQVAPFLFLWLEKAVVSVFGFNELALRLPAFGCSLGSVALFVHLARRLVSGQGLVFATALFAVSYPAIRYSAEAKPYGTDLFVSLGVIVLVTEWLRRPGETRWLWWLAVASPVAIGLSLPALFTTAAASLLILGVMIRHPAARHWLAWLACNASLVVGAAALYLATVRPQTPAEMGFMTEYWADAFVPLTSFVGLVKWLVTTHTGALFAHPVGDKNFGSTLTALLLVAGVVALARSRRTVVALLLLLPLVLHLGAAALQRYPYGGHVKFSMYAAPMISVVMGIGVASLLARFRRPEASLRWSKAAVISLVLLIGIGLGSIVSDVVTPYKTTADVRQRALATWLWHDGNFEDRTVCIKDDLGVSFSPRTWQDLGWSAMYLCNKYIYSPQRLVREPRPAYAPPPAQRYLRCVLYRDLGKGDFQQAAFDHWLAGMKQQYPYVGMERFPLPRHDTRNRRLVTIDYLEIYKFEAPAP